MKNIVVLLVLSFGFRFSVTAQPTEAPSAASVTDITPKDSQFENTVTIEEFNSLVNTLRGINNFFSDSSVQLGINEPRPASELTLDVGGKIGADQYCDADGQNCIDPATWDERPQLELQPPAANCQIRYRAKDAKYQSDWEETALDDSMGSVARFNSGLKHNCSGSGCGVQMGIKCSPNLAVSETASCRIRYRVNHLKQRDLTPWVTTEETEGNDWSDGDWSNVIAEEGSWGDGLNIQAGIECNDPLLRCQLGYKLHNEAERNDWSSSAFTQGPGWKDGDNNLLSASTVRACDQKVGCGLQMQSRCVGTASTLKTKLYLCPRKGERSCPSLCEGQISINETCTYQRQGANNECNLLITEECRELGHLVQ